MNKNIFNPPVFMVDEHHQVLPHWAKLHHEIGVKKVISLDFHTDTLPAFGRYLAAGGTPPEFSQTPEVIAEQLNFLRHDEHFDYALKAGIMEQIVLLSLVNFVETPPENLLMVTPRAAAAEADVDLLSDKFNAWRDASLESDFLRGLLGEIPAEKYILDLDLDYFGSAKQLNPADSEYFKALWRQAAAITVSKEAIWVKLLAKNGEVLNWQKVWGNICSLVEIQPN